LPPWSVEALEAAWPSGQRVGGPRFKSHSNHYLDLFFGSPELRSSATFVIDHVRYINISTWLQGFQVKHLLEKFSLYPSLFWKLRGKRNMTNFQSWPESLGLILEDWYIKHGLLANRLASDLLEFLKHCNVQFELFFWVLCSVPLTVVL